MSGEASENRNTIREPMVFYLRVTSDVFEGRVLDVSVTGARFITERAPEVGKLIDATIHMDANDGSSQQLRLKIKPTWAKRAERPGFFETGCEVHGADADSSRLLKELRTRFTTKRYE